MAALPPSPNHHSTFRGEARSQPRQPSDVDKQCRLQELQDKKKALLLQRQELDKQLAKLTKNEDGLQRKRGTPSRSGRYGSRRSRRSFSSSRSPSSRSSDSDKRRRRRTRSPSRHRTSRHRIHDSSSREFYPLRDRSMATNPTHLPLLGISIRL